MIVGWLLEYVEEHESAGWTEGTVYYTNEDGNLIDDDEDIRLRPSVYIEEGDSSYTFRKVYIDTFGNIYNSNNPILIGGE